MVVVVGAALPARLFDSAGAVRREAPITDESCFDGPDSTEADGPVADGDAVPDVAADGTTVIGAAVTVAPGAATPANRRPMNASR